MRTYKESGLELTLPEGQHFRFTDIPAYKSLSGCHLKEMDFVWIDQGRLVLLEVRDYSQVTDTLTGSDLVPASKQPVPFRFQALLDKVTDSLTMLLAGWAKTNWGQQFVSELPVAARQPMPLQIVVAVELPASLSVHLQGLRDSLNAHLKGRISLADVRTVTLVDYTRLAAHPKFSAFVKIAP